MMIPSADKQLNQAKGDFPYTFSPLPQQAGVLPVQVQQDSSPAEENRNPSKPNTSSSDSNESAASKLFKDIIYYAGLLACMLILIYRVCQYTIEMHFAIPPPLFETKSLTISDLNISDSKLGGIWGVNITFGHSLDDFAEVTYYNLLAGSIYNKQAGNMHKGNLLAMVNPMKVYVQRKEHTKVHLEFTNTGMGAGLPGLDEQVVKEINKEMENGVLHFSLEIVFQVEFQKWEQIWTSSRSNRIGSYCWDLMAGIDRVTGKGRLIDAAIVVPSD